MRHTFPMRLLKFVLIGAMLLALLGFICWMRLPAWVERQFERRLADAGFPGSSLRVESVGLRQLEVLDLSIAGDSWKLRLREGTARYHPFEVFRPELRSVDLDGPEIDLDLESAKPSPAIGSFEVAHWHRLAQEAPARLPLRRLAAVDGRLRLHRGRREAILPFEVSLTNNATTQQLRITVQGGAENGRVHLVAQADRGTGLRVTGQLDLADGWNPWRTFLLPAEPPAAFDELQLGPANLRLDLRSRPEALDLDLDLTAESIGRADDWTISRPALALRLSELTGSESAPRARFTGQAASILYAGIEFGSAQASGEITPDGARLEGTALLETEPFEFGLRLAATGGWATVADFAGEFSAGVLRLREFQPPTALTGDRTLRISGDLETRGRFKWVPGGSLELQPEVELALERVEWLEQDLTVEGVRGIVSGTVPAAPEFARTNSIHVERIRFGDLESTDLELRVARLNRHQFQLELAGAHLLDGRARTPPFLWDLDSETLEAVLELEQVSLGKLAGFFPKFAGSIEGDLHGRLPLRFSAGRMKVGQATLKLAHSRPAWLRYPANGLLTKGIPPNSDRHRQLKLIEAALQNLRLTELVVEFRAPDHPESPIRLRLEGTSSSAEAIIPVKFNLNVNGNLDEVLRLLSIGEIELSL